MRTPAALDEDPDEVDAIGIAAVTAEGWLAGPVALPPLTGGAAAGADGAAWQRALSAVRIAPTLADLRGPLLVVDYADSAADLVATLLDTVAGVDSISCPVRILLLARRAGSWWTELLTRHGRGLVDPRVLDLAPLPEAMASTST